MDNNFDICIIGGGAAGLFACLQASGNGLKVALFEKNTVAGQKLLITGGGRCNLTHMLNPRQFIEACRPYDRFLRHCIHELSPQAVVDFFSTHGLETVCQEDGCVFPVSQRAADVRDLLVSQIKQRNVQIFYAKPVTGIIKTDDGFTITHKAAQVSAQKVIIATGGLSYPKTGSTGDGYSLAKSLGHTITATLPCLVPLVAKQDWVGKLAGVAVDKCGLLEAGDKKKNQITGPLIFTNDGIGGPAVINFSRRILPKLVSEGKVEIIIDLLGEGSSEDFMAELNRMCHNNPKKDILHILTTFFSRSFINMLSEPAGIDMTVKAGQFPKPDRIKLVNAIKSLPLTITGTKSVEQATVTRGGVCIDEIDPTTMLSKKCPGLYFAGEVIDIDGPCGGYNLQIAFATGVLAGKSAAANI